MIENESTQIAPTIKTERILYLDILRGIAIFFILVGNIYSFSHWYLLSADMKENFSAPEVNKLIEYITRIFIEGKFYSIFSILFGIGFIIQYEKFKDNSKRFVPFFRKRMFGLLMFGILHLVFIWMGDILVLYAALGFLLIFFRNFSEHKLLIWALCLIFLRVVNILVIVTVFDYAAFFDKLYLQLWEFLNLPVLQGNIDEKYLNSLNHLIQTDNFFILVKINLITPLLRIASLLYQARIFTVLACFLIGIWVGRQIINKQLLENKTQLKRIVMVGLLLGLSMNILKEFSGSLGSIPPWLVYNATYALGVIPLACAYCALIALLVKSKPRLLIWFTPVGQTALTNYVAQSIISIFIFYGIGLGYSGQVSLWEIMLIVLCVFTMQTFISKIWLNRFKHGPLEWIWRSLTYR